MSLVVKDVACPLLSRIVPHPNENAYIGRTPVCVHESVVHLRVLISGFENMLTLLYEGCAAFDLLIFTHLPAYITLFLDLMTADMYGHSISYAPPSLFTLVQLY